MGIFEIIRESILRLQLSGPGVNPWAFFLLLTLVGPQARGQEVAPVLWRPYVPKVSEYRLELGAAQHGLPLYWMGAGFGRHIGRCLATQSETCQQYLDVLGGVAGRLGQTDTWILVGPRWQYVNFPDRTSSFIRLLAGGVSLRAEDIQTVAPAVGLGWGLVLPVHERADLGLEIRGGSVFGERTSPSRQAWGQALFSVHLKMEKWVSHFADKLKGLGEGAATRTGDLFEKVLAPLKSPTPSEN